MMPLLHHVPETGSTNDDMRARILAGAGHGEAVWTDVQRAGRGRLGRQWQTPPGTSLALSVGIVLPRLHLVAPQLSLMTGVVVARTLQQLTGLAPTLKWPNDLQIGPKKLAGILCEAVQRPHQPALDAVVIGVGINLSLTPQHPAWETLPADVAARMTSIAIEGGRPVDAATLAGALRIGLDNGARALLEDGVKPWLVAWRDLDCTRGRHVLLPAGAHPNATRGVAIDLDDDGALLVEPCHDDGTRYGGTAVRIHAGEIVFLPPP